MSDYFVVRIPRKAVDIALGCIAAALCFVIPLQVHGDNASAGKADGHENEAQVKPVVSQALPDIPGKHLTAVLVNYGPGGKTAAHRHAGDVFAFVVSGTIRSRNSATGPVKDYHAGEAFFEPAGSTHLVSANGSATEPARLLAVFVADDNAQLTTFAK